MIPFLLKLAGLSWLAPVIGPALKAKANPIPANVEDAVVALSDALAAEYDPAIEPELHAIEEKLIPVVNAGLVLRDPAQRTTSNIEGFAQMNVALIVEVAAPNMPIEHVNQLTTDIITVLADAGVK